MTLLAVSSPSWGRIINKPKVIGSGVKCAIAGDSITGFNNRVSSNTKVTNEAEGYFTWVQFYSGCLFDANLVSIDFANNVFDDTLGFNFGRSGDDTTEFLARIQDVVDYEPEVVFLYIGTNDLANTSNTFTSITTNLDRIVRTFTDKGIFVVWTVLLPRSSWGSLSGGEITQMRKIQYQVADWMRTYPFRTQNNLVQMVDPVSALIDPTSATGDPASELTSDGLHMAQKGAQKWGYAVWKAIQSRFGSRALRIPTSQADVYDSTYNPRGNLLTNGLLIGASGSTGTDISGSVADSMTVSRSATAGTITAVCSKGAEGLDGNAGTFQRIVVTAVGTGDTDDSVSLTQTTAITTNFAAGDVIEASCLARWSGLSGKLREANLTLELTDSVAGTYSAVFMDQRDNVDLAPNVDAFGVMRTERLIVGANTTAINIRCRMRYDNTTPGGGTFDFGNISIRKVPANAA